MLHLYENGVEILRKKLKKTNLDTYWDNYNFIIWKKDIGGIYDINGVYRNNTWGIANKFPVTTKGTWALPSKYVRYF
jgi:hypothetical protein